MEHYKKNPMVETLGTVLQLKQVRIHEDWLTGERAQGSFHSHVTLLLWACDGTFTMAGGKETSISIFVIKLKAQCRFACMLL